MSPKKVNLTELEKALEQWKERIALLETKAATAEGVKRNDTLELIEQMKQKQALFEQYLKKVAAIGDRTDGQGAGTLDRMLKDIDETYRKALSYFY